MQANHSLCTHLTTTFVGPLTLCSLQSADNCKEQVVLATPGPAAISLESLLHQQLQAVRNAEQQRTVEEIIYLWSLHNLSKGSMCIRTSLGAVEQPSSHQQVCSCVVISTSLGTSLTRCLGTGLCWEFGKHAKPETCSMIFSLPTRILLTLAPFADNISNTAKTWNAPWLSASPPHKCPYR